MSLLAMQGRMLRSGGSGGGTDPHWANVVSLLHFEGADASTTFTDSTGMRTWTASGNAQIDTASSRFGGSSMLSDGSNDYIYTPTSSDFAFPGDFTLEAYVYLQSSGNYTGDRSIFIVNNSGGISFGLYNGKLALSANALAYDLISSSAVPTLQWVHVAACRDSSTLRLFIDGVLDATATVSRSYISSNSASIACPTTNNFCINGNLDEVRITKGVARYMSSFTPPSAAFPNT